MTSRQLIVLLLISAIAGESTVLSSPSPSQEIGPPPSMITAGVTSCDACDEHATCLATAGIGVTQSTQPPVKPLACVCNEGLVGDGLTCYNTTTCTAAGQSCCGQGYRWWLDLGCVDVDECSLDNKPCGPNLLCQNTPGAFHCLAPSSNASSTPFSGSSLLVFQCMGTLCPAGQDCINVSSTPRCADPCEHYSVLNDPWRATDYSLNNTHCDRVLSWNGWYRLFLGNTSVQMPERCVEKNRCGTSAPLWLRAPHPLLADGVQQRGICGSWSDCCYFQENPIHVKACPGNYYVYKFVEPKLCNLAYCADVNTKVCATCRLTEACVSDDKITWRCENTHTVSPKLECGRSFMHVGFLLAQLKEIGLDASSAHLYDAHCSAHEERNGTIWYQVERKEGSCGNALETNSSHAIYSNSLFIYPLSHLTAVPPVVIPFFCYYSLETETSLDVAIRPFPETDDAVEGVGPKARAVMSLFRNGSYTEAYPAGHVILPADSVLYVGVSVEETEAKRFVTVLENCYANHSPNPEDLKRYFLIQHKCPADRRQVAVTESGSSLKARFSALLLLFQGDQRDLFLHCSLSLCDQSSSSCVPRCSGRAVRSISDSPTFTPLTIGPITCEYEPQLHLRTWEQNLE